MPIKPSLVAKGSAAQQIYLDVIILIHCNLELEDSKPIFFEDNLAHDASQYQTVVKGSAIQNIPSGQTFRNFAVTLTLNNPISQQDTLAAYTVPSYKVWLKKKRNLPLRRYCTNCHILIR